MIDVQIASAQVSLRPAAAVVLYEEYSTTNKSYYGGQMVYATTHQIEVKDGIPVLSAGVAVTKSALVELFEGLDPSTADHPRLIGRQILSKGAHWMVWYTPASVRRVWFDAKVIGKKSAEVSLPALVFAITPEGWFVFALKSNRRPGASSKLYQTPFFNVWKNGKICVGSAKTPTDDQRFETALWEKAFFESAFTHSNINDTPLVHYKGGGNAFWQAMLKGKFSSFPKEVLVDCKLTLDKFISGIGRGGK